MAPQARTATRLPPEERRDEILEAAREVFAERGYQKASMREIARRAGITQAALYYHFENKEDLLIIILEQFSNDFYQSLLGCMTRAQGPEAGLRSMLRTHIDVIGARRKGVRLMSLTLAVDFDRTYTKVVAFDLEREELAGVVQAESTVDSDVGQGLNAALEKLRAAAGGAEIDVDGMFACSSAAGGLRMIVAGLVRELTTKAAREACLGAGAKLVGAYSGGLTPGEMAEIERLAPDIMLLAGGTDGGNEEVVVRNAGLVAQSGLTAPLIIAGNKAAAGGARALLEGGGKRATVVDNVLPELGEMNVEPARAAIRDTFMRHIVGAKGLDKALALAGDIIMPTPMAVLKAASLLADGSAGEEGLGELIVVDVGGATIDVHSIAEGGPRRTGTVVKGLRDPRAKRTVEGDLGIRHNARSILELAGEQMILDNMPPPAGPEAARIDLDRATKELHHDVAALPGSEAEHLVDIGLASAAVGIAAKRHAGSIEEIYFPTGKARVQYGKDLTGVRCLIGTGGVFAHGRSGYWILRAGCFDGSAPASLLPAAPELFLDQHYILFAIGLLAGKYPGPALRIMKRALKKEEHPLRAQGWWRRGEKISAGR